MILRTKSADAGFMVEENNTGRYQHVARCVSRIAGTKWCHRQRRATRGKIRQDPPELTTVL